jgi:hypothetical protein
MFVCASFSSSVSHLVDAMPCHSRNLPHTVLLYCTVTTQSMVMGIVVFGTYDGILLQWKNHHHRQQQHTAADNDNQDTNNNETTTKEASVLVHGAAGAAAGMARSVVWMVWESWSHQKWVPHNPRFLIRTTLHHTAGYGALFGSYQGFRHLLLLNTTTTSTSIIGDDDIVAVVPLWLATAVAGGLAGQVHHVVHHYTSHRKQYFPKIPPRPRFHPTMLSFGPMALCFLAFEYGADGVEELVDYGTKVLSLEPYQQQQHDG